MMLLADPVIYESSGTSVDLDMVDNKIRRLSFEARIYAEWTGEVPEVCIPCVLVDISG